MLFPTLHLVSNCSSAWIRKNMKSHQEYSVKVPEAKKISRFNWIPSRGDKKAVLDSAVEVLRLTVRLQFHDCNEPIIMFQCSIKHKETIRCLKVNTNLNLVTLFSFIPCSYQLPCVLHSFLLASSLFCSLLLSLLSPFFLPSPSPDIDSMSPERMYWPCSIQMGVWHLMTKLMCGWLPN